VAQGQQVFTISWRNPRKEHSHWDMDTYAQVVLEAMDAAADIAGCEKVHVIGNCAGGLLTAATVSHLAYVGELDRIASITLGVCVLDNERSNVVNAFATEKGARVATEISQRRGYLDGRDLASVFLWLRPNELIWPYVINNWLMGKDPPAFDILYWNADTTRMPAGLHRDFLKLATANSLPLGEMELLGTPVDLGAITTDAYIMAGLTDHITPWQACYRSTQLLGGTKRFVLGTSGHIQAILNPPGARRASFRNAGELTPPSADEWLAASKLHEGSWWPDWNAWLAERSAEMRPAPEQLGNARYPVVGEAPGEYCFET
jgi:poly[(R)-3-hydroxyalkanoate] polymerase subunit PhaC